MMQQAQKQYGVTNNLTELEIPWTRGKRSADGTMCVMIQPDERTTGMILLFFHQMQNIFSRFLFTFECFICNKLLAFY